MKIWYIWPESKRRRRKRFVKRSTSKKYHVQTLQSATQVFDVWNPNRFYPANVWRWIALFLPVRNVVFTAYCSVQLKLNTRLSRTLPGENPDSKTESENLKKKKKMFCDFLIFFFFTSVVDFFLCRHPEFYWVRKQLNYRRDSDSYASPRQYLIFLFLFRVFVCHFN